MNLTTKGRYAVMAMVDLSLHQEQSPMALADIANRQDITINYLEQLFAKLKKARLVSSVRGPGGGYKLARSSMEISLLDIIKAVDEPLKMTRCNEGAQGGCLKKDSKCITHHIWKGLGEHINCYLDAITLQDVYSQSSECDLKTLPFGATPLFSESYYAK